MTRTSGPSDGAAPGVSAPAARLAIGATAVALLCLAALHILSPEFQPSWRVVSEYAFGRFGWVLSLMFLSSHSRLRWARVTGGNPVNSTVMCFFVQTVYTPTLEG